jgi:tRNA nucleotidyltransferase (CCA-adding enzyme)
VISEFETLFLEWQQFLDHLGEMEVLDAPSWRRIIDGTQLAEALDLKPGKWMSAALDVCMAWQFRNPKATDPAGAIEEVKRKAGSLGISRSIPEPSEE